VASHRRRSVPGLYLERYLEKVRQDHAAAAEDGVQEYWEPDGWARREYDSRAHDLA
jgi:hypothetical protein